MDAATMQSHTMVLGNSSANTLYIWGGYGWAYRRSLPPTFGIRVLHSAVLAKDNTTIYYIGGRLATLTGNTANASTYDLSSNYTLTDPGMSSIYAYNTVSDSWANITVGGRSVPSSRVLHSTVLLSDGNILLYGGSRLDNNTVPVDDYFYILNTTNVNALQWSRFDISTKEAPGPGPRYGHSAIRVSSTTVFILFGGTASVPATNEVHILDTANWAWTRSFASLGMPPSSTTLPQPTSTPETPDKKGNDGGLSGGATAGIVIGVLAVRKKITWR
ncbi:hypothetical protein BX666DRAFT_1334178 [Dichotomocladium elegans]|nr:hypothetical protein BX666DRAFT_1334178 [Dichotomocladium elegans]